ncbi:MAG: zf-HC2 domain-containing protein [Polyangiaceae bacterium]
MSTPDDDDLPCKELVELVTDYLEGAMPASEVQRFEAHLVICTACKVYLDRMRAVVRVAGKAAVAPPMDPRMKATLLAAFRQRRE